LIFLDVITNQFFDVKEWLGLGAPPKYVEETQKIYGQSRQGARLLHGRRAGEQVLIFDLISGSQEEELFDAKQIGCRAKLGVNFSGYQPVSIDQTGSASPAYGRRAGEQVKNH
jgi:hypothetical protein